MRNTFYLIFLNIVFTIPKLCKLNKFCSTIINAVANLLVCMFRKMVEEKSCELKATKENFDDTEFG